MEKTKKIGKKIRRVLILIMGYIYIPLALLAFAFSVYSSKVKITIDSNADYQNYMLYDLSESSVRQEFIAAEERLDSVELNICNIDETTEGFLMIDIFELSGKTVFSRKYDISKISPGTFNGFEIGTTLQKNSSYILEIGFEDGISNQLSPKVMIDSSGQPNTYLGIITWADQEDSFFKLMIRFNYSVFGNY